MPYNGLSRREVLACAKNNLPVVSTLTPTNQILPISLEKQIVITKKEAENAFISSWKEKEREKKFGKKLSFGKKLDFGKVLDFGNPLDLGKGLDLD